MSCVWMLQRGHSRDGCVLASTLWNYDLRKGYLFFSELGKGGTSEAGKSLFRAVVVRTPRPMEGNGVTPIFRSLQNCQFHHRRLE